MTRPARWTQAAVCVLAWCTASAAYAAGPADELNALFQEAYEWSLAQYPSTAMSRGDYRYADRLTDLSLQAIQSRYDVTVQHLERLLQIDRAQLGEQDRLNFDLFEWRLRRGIEGHRFRMFLAPMNSRSGLHQQIAQMHERVRFKLEADYVNYLKRLEQVPQRVDDTIALMSLGLEEGRTPPQVTMLGVPEMLSKLTSGGLQVLAEPFTAMPAHLSRGTRQALRDHFDNVAYPEVLFAVQRFAQFFEQKYLPGCRKGVAAYDLPDGAAYYDHLLRVHTTSQDWTATTIHELGLQEVARIRAEMMTVIRQADFMESVEAKNAGGDEELFDAFIAFLRSDPRFYHDTPEALLAEYREICKRIDGELPGLFRVLPRLPYGVKPIPEFMAPKQTTAYYQHGDLRNAQAGFFYANTHALDQRPRYEMIALALHEAVPGHHLQYALAQELEDVPEFRKVEWFTAFGEGWALYGERLGLEMGLYDDPYDNFGRLLYEMWRACRLVVDPGVHALGWSREQAIQFMLDNTALSRLNIENEVDRYISWPGQAVAYKIGELKMRALRRDAEQQLGQKFDVREFHNVVLGAGSIPLAILEARVKAWISGQLAHSDQANSALQPHKH